MDDSIISLVADSSHQKKFELCLKQDKFDKNYLDSIYVKRYEILDWCARVYCDPPPCWLPKKESDVEVIGNETRGYRPSEVANTTQQREAAHIKHEPIENLKKECILFWLQHKSYSNNHAARKFYEQLSQEKQRLLKSSNAERTLSNAISQYRNRKNLLKNDKFPHWLKNFTPENP